MLTRAFDILAAAAGLVVAAPMLALAALGIKATSPGPVFYPAQRMGKNGVPYRMAKFRTMHVRSDEGAQITGPNDPRIFGFGKFLRQSKIDELPQLWNVLVGDMSFVGPRPEAVGIVREHYTDWMMRTLAVRPGITSPGAIFYYTRGDALLDDSDPEGSYLRNLLAPKLAIELAYIERQNLLSDIGVIVRTLWTIVLLVAGKRDFTLPREAVAARRWDDSPVLRGEVQA